MRFQNGGGCGIALQHLAVLVQNNHAHHELGHGLAVQRADFAVVVDGQMQVQRALDVRDEQLAKINFFLAKGLGIFRPGNTQAIDSPISGGNVGGQHMKDALRFAITLVVIGVAPISLGNDVGNGHKLIGHHACERAHGNVGIARVKIGLVNARRHNQANVFSGFGSDNQGGIVACKAGSNGLKAADPARFVERRIIDGTQNMAQELLSHRDSGAIH